MLRFSRKSLLPAVTVLLLLTLPSSTSAGSVAEEAPHLEPEGGGPAAGPLAGEDSAGVESLELQVGRELARLDERLGLGTFPDGSPLWPARLAAALDRLSTAVAQSACEPPCEAIEDVLGRDLLHRLAIGLRRLGVERPLARPPGAMPNAMPEGAARTRAERLREALEGALSIHAKLDLHARADAARNRLSQETAPANDDCADALVVDLGTYTGSTAGATPDGSASCGASSSAPDAWFRFTAASDEAYVFDTFGSSYDTVLSLHTGCPSTGGLELTCNDDAPGTVESRVSYSMTLGEEVWIRVSGFGGSTGAYTLNVGTAGELGGTVTRQDTGAPLEGIEVEVYNSSNWWLGDALTGADGSYTVGGLPPDTYYVLARSGEFIDELYDGIACPFYSYCHPPDGTPVVVSSGSVGGIDFALDPASLVTGALTDAATSEALDGYVYLYSETGDYLSSRSTGPDGSYELDGLAAGTYFVRAEAYEYRPEVYDDVPCLGGSCDVTTGTPIEVPTGTTVAGIDFALDRLGTIAGTVVEATTGNPLSSTTVVAYDSQGYWLQSGWTASDGTYRISPLPPGTHFVRTDAWDHLNELYDDIPCHTSCDVTTGNPVEVFLSTTVSGIDFDLYRLGSITGTVTHTATGSPIGNISVSAHESSTLSSWYGWVEEDGSYEIPRLPPGTYFVRTDAWDYLNEIYDDVPCPSSCDVTAGTPVDVALETATPGIGFALDRLGVMTGTATAADTGEPLNVEIELLDAAGDYLASYYRFGAYEIVGMPVATCYVRARYTGWPDEYQDEMFRNLPCEPSCNPADAVALPSTVNQTIAGVDFALAHCPFESYADLVGTLIFSTYEAEACMRVSARDVTVASGGDLTLRSGRSIALGDGFVVEAGGSFRAVIEPAWGDD